MTSQDKYNQCLLLLSEMHEIIYILIETEHDRDLDAMAVVEESIKLLKSLQIDNTGAHFPPRIRSKKDKKRMH